MPEPRTTTPEDLSDLPISTSNKLVLKSTHLALFSLALDRKLRRCDLICLRVRDAFLRGAARLGTGRIYSGAGRPPSSYK